MSQAWKSWKLIRLTHLVFDQTLNHLWSRIRISNAAGLWRPLQATKRDVSLSEVYKVLPEVALHVESEAPNGCFPPPNRIESKKGTPTRVHFRNPKRVMNFRFCMTDEVRRQPLRGRDDTLHRGNRWPCRPRNEEILNQKLKQSTVQCPQRCLESVWNGDGRFMNLGNPDISLSYPMTSLTSQHRAQFIPWPWCLAECRHL